MKKIKKPRKVRVSRKDTRMELNPKKVKFLSRKSTGSTYKDIKRQAITLGMPFPDAVSATLSELQIFIKNSNNVPDRLLVHKYDKWLDDILEKRGYPKDHHMRHYMLSLGYTGPNDLVNTTSEGKKKTIVVRDSGGYIRGTKKALTRTLAKNGKDIKETITEVLKQFPDANTSSIKSWYNKAKREA